VEASSLEQRLADAPVPIDDGLLQLLGALVRAAQLLQRAVPYPVQRSAAGFERLCAQLSQCPTM
jgi:hypothetical protein